LKLDYFQTVSNLAETRFGAEQENPSERRFSILFFKRTMNERNDLLAHKPINKFLLCIFRVNLKPCNLKKHQRKRLRRKVTLLKILGDLCWKILVG